MKAAIEQIFNGSFAEGTSYDASRITIPPAPTTIRQWSLGSGPADKFVGPNPPVIARPVEQSVSIPAGLLHVLQWSSTQWWVFYSDNAAAAATRRIGLYFFNPVANTMTWRGFITLTPPTATLHTIRGFRMARTTYVVGQAAASGTAVTGSGGTLWSASRLAVGSRIGFGSTDPTAITTWYEISAIGSDTSITLTGSAGTIAAGPYVIEELRAVVTTTNATATNGGLFVAKGLRIENFTSGGTTIAAATTVDNVRAVMWLKDAATITNTAAGGLDMDALASQTLHDVYVTNGAATSLIIYRYNIRSALTLTGGAATLTAGVDMTITGSQTVTGNLSQNGNGRLATLNHGPGSGVKSLYLVTASRIIRVAAANITTGSTTFISDQMTENPPGGVSTTTAFSAFANLEHADSIDRLIVSNGAAPRHYVTQYRTDAGQMNHIWLSDDRQNEGSAADATSVPHPQAGQPAGAGSTPCYFWGEGGFLFQVRQNTANTVNIIYAYPLACHWTYAQTTGQRVIFPKITLGAVPTKFYRVLHQSVDFLGNKEFGKATEPFRLLYRTSGIDDNSGSWTLVPEDGSLSGVSAASAIQFAAEFRILGDVCIPGRLQSIGLLYETADNLPSQYRWNHADFNATTGVFAWVQAALFGASPGVHTIEIYRADTNALVLSQASSGTTNGTFEYWNGSAWTAGLGPDTLATRRRFVPTAGLPSGIDLYASITVA